MLMQNQQIKILQKTLHLETPALLNFSIDSGTPILILIIFCYLMPKLLEWSDPEMSLTNPLKAFYV